MRIAVAGGTGTVGRPLVDALIREGHEPIVLARSTGVDLRNGVGLAAALGGVDAVVDVTSTAALSGRKSVAFFTTVTRNLLEAERTAGVPHHVALSIVGAAAVDANYYAGKAAQERLVSASGSGWTILRCTQFHEFVPQVLAQAEIGPIHVIPRVTAAPVAAGEVATHLAALALGGPRGLVPDLAGPRVEDMVALARRYLAATGAGGRVVALPLPGRFGRSLRDGTLIPATGSQRGRQTFEEWLEHRVLAP